VELNILVQRVVITNDRQSALAEVQSATNLTAEQLDELPTLLVGTHQQVADQLVANRERFGFSYVTVLEDNLERFAPVIELVR
jgi:alkanesulfonate monooxygenase SsuD/methylene tetrahydromethanopterin reductase-like flavin-dependent oxidoreductase (luciferase family)